MFAYLFGILLALITLLPLTWKWQLGMRPMGLLIVLLASLASLLVLLVGVLLPLHSLLQVAVVWLFTVAAFFAFLAYRFYRDPERTVPDLSDAIVSPADGKVIYIRESRDGTLPVSTKHGRDYRLDELMGMPFYHQEAVVVGISMSFLDVHVNRAPIAGQVVLQRHFPGRFGSLRRPEMVFENERATTVIAQGGLQVAVVQIASRLVRQIASFVHEGQEVAPGQRIGIIRLGSQVDLVLPRAVKVTVQPGAEVKAGQSIIATYEFVRSQEAGAQEHPGGLQYQGKSKPDSA